MNKGRLEQLFELHKGQPNDTFILYAIAKEYIKLDQLDEALKFYLQALNNDPNYTGVYYHLGKLYEQMGKAELAMQTYRQGMEKCKALGKQHDYSELAGALELISVE